ncbi:MAG: BACON domain-containing protein [Bacteroidaceae bacterium]|nr:BACON domain-containing protein [Bacteroidaceae bacterium]
MKKILSAIMLAATLFTACGDDKYEFHQTYFTPMHPDGLQLYADQTVDSVRVISYDPWQASTNIKGEPWFTITPTQCAFAPGEAMRNTRMDILTTPNTSGKIRSGIIQVNSYYNIGMGVYQFTWLHIDMPIGKLVTTDDAGNALPKDQQYETFEAYLSHNQGNFEMNFTTYSDHATLTSNVDWITPEVTTFEAGQHYANLVCAPNPEPQERVGTVVLTSNGVSTVVTFKQERRNN